MTLFSRMAEVLGKAIAALSPVKNPEGRKVIKVKKFTLKKTDIKARMAEFHNNADMREIVFDAGLNKRNATVIAACIKPEDQVYRYVMKTNGAKNIEGSDVGVKNDAKNDTGYGEGASIKIVKKKKYLKFAPDVEIGDLSRYHIQKGCRVKNSFTAALRATGKIPQEMLDKIASRYGDNFIPLKQMHEIANECRICLVVKYLGAKLQYGFGEKCVQLGLVGSHYFILEKTIWNNYAIKNYFKLRDVPDWNRIYNDRGETRNYAIDSFALITLARDIGLIIEG